MENPLTITDLVKSLIDIFLHLDVHLAQWAQTFGPWVYVLSFLVIFCETGLVILPFLPGDSFLFALGALCALDGSPLQIAPLALLLFVASVLGDGCNYAIGSKIGKRMVHARWINPAHLAKTEAFYERHGGKTIILARFVPIIRTFAPFVAGLGNMSYRRFASYNVIGGALWTVPFLLGGYFLGNAPIVKRNFHVVVLAIIVISILPAVVEFLRARSGKKNALNSVV